MKIPKNLLIVRTDRIGDVVLSLPMANTVKKYYPECRISFYVRNYTKSLVENHSNVDGILLLDEKNGKPSLMPNIKLLKNKGFDTAILVYPTFLLALIVFLSGIKRRIGTGYRWYSFLFNEKIYSHRKYAEKHELEFNIELLKQIGINEKVIAGQVDFDIPVDPDSSVKIEKLFSDRNIDKKKPVIIIHPGSGGSAVDLPKEKFKELVLKLDNSGKYNIIVTGSKSERKLCDYITESGNILNFAGQFGLKELTALIGKADIFVANSTGPLHIAAALNKYTVGFYPKILACSAERWGPYTEKSYVFKPFIDCTDCTREQCERLDCMSSINIDDVFIKIEQIYSIITNNGEIHV